MAGESPDASRETARQASDAVVNRVDIGADADGGGTGEFDTVATTNDAVQAAELAARLAEARDTLAIVLENTPEAHLAYLDTEFRFVLVNSTYVRGSGVPREELLGRYHFDLFPNEENERIFRQVRDTGEAVEFKAKPFVFERQPWRGVTYWDWTLTPVKGDTGAVKGLVLSLVDVTERVRRQQLAEAMSELDSLLHSTLEFEEIIGRILMGASKAAGCESVGIALREGLRWRAAYVDERLRPTAEGREFSPEEIPVAEMAAERRGTVVFNDVSEDERIRIALEPFGVKSILNVPLFTRDEVIGVIGFHYHSEPVPFSQPVIEFAERLAQSASLALTNAKLFQEERRVADALRRVLAHPLPEVPGIEIGVVYRPAYEAERVGGDFYDVFEVGDGRVAVLVGDVSGKGLKAAGLTETVRSAVRALAYIDPSPASVMARLNRTLLPQFDAGTFATAVFAVIDSDAGEAVIASAGHPAPILCRRRRLEHVDVPTGHILGAFEGDYGEGRVSLGGGSLMLFTDGVTEARKGRLVFGSGRLMRAMARACGRHPQDVADQVLASVLEFGRGRLSDDVAIVVVRRSEPDPYDDCAA